MASVNFTTFEVKEEESLNKLSRDELLAEIKKRSHSKEKKVRDYWLKKLTPFEEEDDDISDIITSMLEYEDRLNLTLNLDEMDYEDLPPDHSFDELVKRYSTQLDKLYKMVSENDCEDTDPKFIQALIDGGWDINKSTALIDACEYRYVKLVTLLLEKGSSPDNSTERSFEIETVIGGHGTYDIGEEIECVVEIIKLLLKAGAKPVIAKWILDEQLDPYLDIIFPPEDSQSCLDEAQKIKDSLDDNLYYNTTEFSQLCSKLRMYRQKMLLSDVPLENLVDLFERNDNLEKLRQKSLSTYKYQLELKNEILPLLTIINTEDMKD